MCSGGVRVVRACLCEFIFVRLCSCVRPCPCAFVHVRSCPCVFLCVCARSYMLVACSCMFVYVRVCSCVFVRVLIVPSLTHGVVDFEDLEEGDATE